MGSKRLLYEVGRIGDGLETPALLALGQLKST